MKTVIAILLFSTLLFASPASGDDTSVTPISEAWLEAQTQYAEGRYPEAFGNFYRAAILDHAQAQEIVGMMYLLGSGTYGPGVARNVQEGIFWLGQAGRNGREVARYLHCVASGAAPGASNRAQPTDLCVRVTLDRR